MGKRFLYLGTFLFFCIFIGCKEIEKNENLKTKTQSVEPANSEQYSNLKLKNGEKWKIDDGMMAYLRTMEKDIISFLESKNQNYKTLADSLVKNVNLLTSNCTMSGDAHEQLHIWLVPYINSINELALSKDRKTKEKELNKLNGAFKIFNKYFR